MSIIEGQIHPLRRAAAGYKFLIRWLTSLQCSSSQSRVVRWAWHRCRHWHDGPHSRSQRNHAAVPLCVVPARERETLRDRYGNKVLEVLRQPDPEPTVDTARVNVERSG
jgi:hypothetical protein